MLERILSPDFEKYDGIRPINIYAMRVVYMLMGTLLAMEVWTHILTFEGRWEPSDAMDGSVWAAFSVFAWFGLFRTVAMIPILLLEITYKTIWLVLVTLPLWQAGDLSDASTDGMLFPFALVILPILAMPWGYVVKRFLLPTRASR